LLLQNNFKLFQLPLESFLRVQSVKPSANTPMIRNYSAVLKAKNPDSVFGSWRLKLLNTVNVPKQINNTKCW
jgi:hypothetical protein